LQVLVQMATTDHQYHHLVALCALFMCVLITLGQSKI